MDNTTAIFEDIKVALQGTTILPTPRVSRETIISVLQSHTDLIMNLRRDHKALTIKVNEIDLETQLNKKNLKIVEVETQHMKRDIETLYRLSDEFRKEMDELSEKVAELYVLKKQVNEQKDFIESLSTQFHKFSSDTLDYIATTSKTMNTLQGSCDQTQFQLKEMKDYVDHFGDNLILNSQQIMVDSYAGFANRPLTLTEILRICRQALDEGTVLHAEQTEKIKKVATEVESKAPDTVLFNIATLEKKVGTIELHIQKEEEQGMGALRKTCEELSVHMQSVQLELAEKIDRESVGFIVHEKYEEIVRYLQDALQSSLEDESNFKQKADEIQEMVILLSNSKADRTEIANMQEVMVKSEALLKKVGAQMNLKDKIKEFVSKKDLEALLAGKVDKAEFEQQLAQALQNSRRLRQQNAMGTSLQPVVDEAMGTPQYGNPSGGLYASGGVGVSAMGGGGYGYGAVGGGYADGGGGSYEERQPSGMSVVVSNRPGSNLGKSGAGGKAAKQSSHTNSASANSNAAGGGRGSMFPSVNMQVHPGPTMTKSGKHTATNHSNGPTMGNTMMQQQQQQQLYQQQQQGVSLPLVDQGRLMAPNQNGDNENEVVPVMAIGQSFQPPGATGASSSGGGNASPTTLSGKSMDFGSFAKGRATSKSSTSARGHQHQVPAGANGAGSGGGGTGNYPGVGGGGGVINVPGMGNNPAMMMMDSDDAIPYSDSASNVGSTAAGYVPGTFAAGAAAGSSSPGVTMGGVMSSGPGYSAGKMPNQQPNMMMSQSTPNLAGVSTGGLQPNLPQGYGASEFPYVENAQQYRMNYAEQSKLTDHLAYLHGPVVGGGFNARTAHIARAVPAGNTVPTEDVEGQGMMLPGADGRMYYKDLTMDNHSASFSNQ